MPCSVRLFFSAAEISLSSTGRMVGRASNQRHPRADGVVEVRELNTDSAGPTMHSDAGWAGRFIASK